jgi:hypothetical protein
LLGSAVGEPAALTEGYGLAFAIGVGLVVAALIVAVTVLRAAEKAPDEPVRERDRQLDRVTG